MADVFKELFKAEQTFLEYEDHPSDRVLRYYLKERLPKSIRPPSEVLEGLLRGKLAEWGEFEVAVHVRTCKRCTARLEWLQLPFWKRWLHHPISKRAVEYTEREPVVGWRPAWVLATAALLVLALGSIGTLYFQVTKLREEITALRLADEQEKARLQEAINKLGEAVGKTEQSTAAAIEELKEIVIASTGSAGVFEGAKDERLIEVTVNKDLSGYLRIYERIRGEVLFEGLVKRGSSIMKFGQSFEISWSLQDGYDALSIRGWEKIKRTGKGWQAVSEPELVSDKPLECEARLIIIFPRVEGRRCP